LIISIEGILNYFLSILKGAYNGRRNNRGVEMRDLDVEIKWFVCTGDIYFDIFINGVGDEQIYLEATIDPEDKVANYTRVYQDSLTIESPGILLSILKEIERLYEDYIYREYDLKEGFELAMD
jgi:hypothetical protein